MKTKRTGLWLELGQEEYLPALALQERVSELRRHGGIPDTVILLEHQPCITLGRGSQSSHILVDEHTLEQAGVQVCFADRGGDVTYHGPGQLVFYTILDLNDHGRDVHAHARRLEEVMIRTAAFFGVESSRREGFPGVWASRGKLGALGVSVHRWVTMHGGALNVSPDLGPYSFIVPCGLRGMGITCLEGLLGETVDMAEARRAMKRACADVFGLEFRDPRYADSVPARDVLTILGAKP